MSDVTFENTFFIPQYQPNKVAVYVVTALFFVFGLVLLFLSRRARNYRVTSIGVLVAMMLIGAYVARRFFFDRRMEDLAPFVAFSVLNSLAPNFINLINYLLLVNMLKSLVHGPSRKAITGFHVFAVVMAVTFGVLSGIGSGHFQEIASLSQLKIASTLLKVSVAGQIAVNILLLVATGYFLAKCGAADGVLGEGPSWHALRWPYPWSSVIGC